MIRQSQLGLKPLIEINLASITRKESGELDISQSTVAGHVHDLDKSIQNYPTVPHVAKILQNFWLTQVVKSNEYVRIYESGVTSEIYELVMTSET